MPELQTAQLRVDRDRRRWVAGVSLSDDGRQLSSALVACYNHGWDCRPEVIAARSQEVPRKIAALYARLQRSGVKNAAIAAVLAAELAELQATLLDDLLQGEPLGAEKLLAVGVYDCGLWHRQRHALTGYLALCDAARLADLTGHNVIDAFAARDLAQDGQGGPLLAGPQWVLLRDTQRGNVLLDLDDTVRMTWLPASRDVEAVSRVVAADIGPGLRLLDRLVTLWTNGQPTERTQTHRQTVFQLARQGQPITELLNAWLDHPFFSHTGVRWHALGVASKSFANLAQRVEAGRGWALPDVLATAMHFMAEFIARALGVHLPVGTRIDEIVLTGPMSQDGLEKTLLAERLKNVAWKQVADFDIPHAALSPACAAILALLHLDQTPASLPGVTGAIKARVLGRLTPGSPQRWQQLLRSLADTKPAVVSLRSAL